MPASFRMGRRNPRHRLMLGGGPRETDMREGTHPIPPPRRQQKEGAGPERKGQGLRPTPPPPAGLSSVLPWIFPLPLQTAGDSGSSLASFAPAHRLLGPGRAGCSWCRQSLGARAGRLRGRRGDSPGPSPARPGLTPSGFSATSKGDPCAPSRAAQRG